MGCRYLEHGWNGGIVAHGQESVVLQSTVNFFHLQNEFVSKGDGRDYMVSNERAGHDLACRALRR